MYEALNPKPIISDEDGTFVKSADQGVEMDQASCEHVAPPSEATLGEDQLQHMRGEHKVMQLLTYNALSLSNLTDQALVATMLEANDTSAAGFQESRDKCDEVSEFARYRRFHAASQNGQGGCQLWLKKIQRGAWIQLQYEVVRPG